MCNCEQLTGRGICLYTAFVVFLMLCFVLCSAVVGPASMLCILPLADSCSFWEVPVLGVAVASRLTAKAAALGQVELFFLSWPAANVLKLGKPAGACPQHNCRVTHVALKMQLPTNKTLQHVHLRLAPVCAVKSSQQAGPKLTARFGRKPKTLWTGSQVLRRNFENFATFPSPHETD